MRDLISGDRRTDSRIVWSDPKCLSCNCITAGVAPDAKTGGAPSPACFVGCGDQIVRSVTLKAPVSRSLYGSGIRTTHSSSAGGTKSGSLTTEKVSENMRGMFKVCSSWLLIP